MTEQQMVVCEHGRYIGRYPRIARWFPKRFVIFVLDQLEILGLWDMPEGGYYVHGHWSWHPWRSRVPRALGWRRVIVAFFCEWRWSWRMAK